MRVTVLASAGERQHVAIADGVRQLRLDVDGPLLKSPVRLEYQLAGLHGLEPRLLTLQRLLALHRLGRFARGLEPIETRAKRWTLMLRAHDLQALGASQREIATELFGPARVSAEWRTTSDSLRLQVQRLVRDAARLVDGGYLDLLAPQPPSSGLS